MNDPAIESKRLAVVLATICVNITAVCFFRLVPWSDWRTGLALNLFDNLLLLAHVVRRRDGMMLHLMAFGLVLGFVELVADAWLVDVTRTLDYSIGGGPMLWRSPVWMPIAWQIVAVQFGYIGMRLFESLKVPGLLLTGLLGALNIPFYEEMALHIHWWRYSGCRMLLHTPYYIIVGEFLITVAIGFLARSVRRENWPRTIAAGALAGALIFVGYAGAFLLTDGWSG